MYTVGVVYDTPAPPPGFGSDHCALEPLAQALLNARAGQLEAMLADLHSPDLMPPNLRRAHQALD